MKCAADSRATERTSGPSAHCHQARLIQTQGCGCSAFPHTHLVQTTSHLPYIQISQRPAKPYFLGVPGETAFRSYTAGDPTINRVLLNSEDEGGGLHPGHTGHKGLIVYST